LSKQHLSRPGSLTPDLRVRDWRKSDCWTANSPMEAWWPAADLVAVPRDPARSARRRAGRRKAARCCRWPPQMRPGATIAAGRMMTLD
jgi:hypothetical protein